MADMEEENKMDGIFEHMVKTFCYNANLKRHEQQSKKRKVLKKQIREILDYQYRK